MYAVMGELRYRKEDGDDEAEGYQRLLYTVP